MKSNSLKKYLIIITLPILILLSMTVKPLITYSSGEEILIKTKPCDPRDVFRGDHVVLNYDINEISADKVPKELTKEDANYKLRNKKLYVILKKNGNYYEVDHATFEKPSSGLYLNCKYSYQLFSANDTSKPENQKQNLKTIVVSYNLDKYFVPENTGKSLEELSRKGQLTARVKVWKGYGYLVQIF